MVRHISRSRRLHSRVGTARSTNVVRSDSVLFPSSLRTSRAARRHVITTSKRRSTGEGDHPSTFPSVRVGLPHIWLLPIDTNITTINRIAIESKRGIQQISIIPSTIDPHPHLGVTLLLFPPSSPLNSHGNFITTRLHINSQLVLSSVW